MWVIIIEIFIICGHKSAKFGFLGVLHIEVYVLGYRILGYGLGTGVLFPEKIVPKQRACSNFDTTRLRCSLISAAQV